MTMEMVEKVARAICRSMLQDPDLDYEVHHQDGLVKGWKMYESEARAAIEATQVMWQPISTAPKDMTEILCCFVGQFDKLVCFVAIGTPYGIVAQGYAEPTHWMPLPPKPEGQ